MEKKRRLRIPIRLKTAIMILVFALAIVEISMTYFTLVSSRTNRNNYMKTADNISKTVANIIDVDDFLTLKNQVKSIVDNSEKRPTSDEWGSDDWNEYTAKFDDIKNSQLYIDTAAYLGEIEDWNSPDDPSKPREISCIYLSYVDVFDDKGYCIYVCDGDKEEPCPPGCLDPLYDINSDVLTNPERGFPAYITNTPEYGYLATSGTPIVKDNTVVGYAFVDISMSVVRGIQANNITRLFIYLMSTVIAIAIIGLLIVHLIFFRPIKRMYLVAKSYDINDPDGTHEAFEKLKVKTHDEIEDLAESMKIIEADVNNKINELNKVNEDLRASKEETKEMADLANKDGLTGVQNKVAYNREVDIINKQIEEDKEGLSFGIAMIDLNYLKNTNDEFGHDAGDSALISLAEIICNVFKHSPVYRIGGDEFVIILRGRDYVISNKLIKRFNDRIETTMTDKDAKSSIVSAAIGYSSFNKETDTCVDDVFKRADKAMYERKRQMKHED